MSKGIPHALATGGPDPYNESFGRVFKQDRDQAKLFVSNKNDYINSSTQLGGLNNSKQYTTRNAAGRLS